MGRSLVGRETKSRTAQAQAITPVVWLITAYRAGEREQLLALAEALAWPYEIKEISHKKYAWRTNLFRGSSLSGINCTDSSPLQAPWPDLVLAAGMRNEPICRWVRNQSGGHSKIVHIGRPWADPSHFDLVITTPQYRLPERPNVLQNSTTLHRISQQRLAQAGQRFQTRVDSLAMPYIAVIVGGDSGPYTFGKIAAKRLAAQASALAEKRGGSLLVTTSARTTDAALDTLKQWTRVPAQFYRWQKADPDNPYYAYLALADEIIVTADSMSMLTEACATRKPVYMFDPNTGEHAMRRQATASNKQDDVRISAITYRWLMQSGPQRLSRDIRLVHDRLIAEGRAVWLGQKFPAHTLSELPDLDRAVQRVRALFNATTG